MRSLKFFLLFISLLSVSGWCACGYFSSQGQCAGGAASCTVCHASGVTLSDYKGSFSVSGETVGSCNGGTVTLSCNGNNGYLTDITGTYSRECVGSDYGARYYFSGIRCDTKCEVDSLKCVGESYVWDSENCLCNDVCGTLRAQCTSSGGRFTGRVLDQNGEKCCSAVCDRCNDDANSKIDALKTKYCCDAGFAPPAESQSCYSPPGISGCGMTTLQRLNNTLDYQCRDPNSSQEASQSYYEKCFPCEGEDCPSSSSSGDPGSSSGGGNSSSGGGSSGSQYPEGCSECPWLDSILDTLTAQKSLVEGMYLCVVYPDMCNNGNASDDKDSVIVNLDSNMLVGVTANQDSLKDLLRSIIDINGHIDTTLLSVYENLGGSSFDTTLRKVVQGGFSSVDTSLGRINGNINSMDMNNRNRLDSILGRIPAHVFDSIRKYQGASIDRLDTLLFGRGAGFSMVDSLTDTVRKYFKISNHYDSLYMRKFASFDSTLMDRLDNMTFGTDFENLGYGDTATSTLRQDLFSISEEIQRGIASFDSSVSVEIDSMLRLLNPGPIDTVGLGVEYGGIVARGERRGDSIVNSLGWGGIDTLNIDSLYARALSGYKSDSISQSVLDSLDELGGRLNDSLVAKNNSIKNALPGVLDSMADSLVLWAPFADFDSIIYSSIGAHIPNRADCPEDCQKWTVSIPIIGLHSYTVDFGLCLGRASFAGMSVLGFLKLLIRIIVAYTCIMTVGKVLVRMV